MTATTLDFRRAVRAVILATSPEARPELAPVLTELRPYVEAWEPGHTPPRGLASLWAALCGVPKRADHARKYLAGVQPCTRGSKLAPEGWTVEAARRGGRPRIHPPRDPGLPRRPVGRPKGSKNRTKEAGDSAAPKLSPEI